ncbi:MAG: hypothetical protein K8L97_34025 [Anaerolineae bacterium]|nr:hypothetical protein [Anaerolineae bacterium]
MSRQKSPKSESIVTNPQVLVAIIGGVVTVLVAFVGIIPNLVNNQPTATPQPTVIVVTATPQSPIATQISVETRVTAILPTEAIGSVQSNPPPIQPVTGNVLLMYDSESFTLINQSDQTLPLEEVVFRSSRGEWDARDWGPSVYNSLPANQCLRLRDATVGQRQPPAPCRDKIYGLQVVGTSALFWVGVDTFEVIRAGQVIATCSVSETTCLIQI